MLEGLARTSRRCTIEGRAAMSLDLSCVEKALRGLAPTAARVSLRSVDSYIKAFYIPWQELEHWCQIHLPEYGKVGAALSRAAAAAAAAGLGGPPRPPAALGPGAGALQHPGPCASSLRMGCLGVCRALSPLAAAPARRRPTAHRCWAPLPRDVTAL
jgi:hypothetical protein